jgi:hypothetical protein
MDGQSKVSMLNKPSLKLPRKKLLSNRDQSLMLIYRKKELRKELSLKSLKRLAPGGSSTTES